MNSKRVFATLIALALMLTLFPVTALGAEGAGATSLTEAMFTVDTGMEVHTGRPITKTIAGQDGGKTLVEDVDYTVAYAHNTNLGTATITIYGIGDYAGTLRYTFAIDVLTDSREDYLITADGKLAGYAGAQTDLVIPEGVTGIYEYAVFDKVTSVTFPSTLTDISENTFLWSGWLTSIQVHENNPVYSAQDGVLFNKDKTALILYPTLKEGAYTVPDGVEEIAPYAFSTCRNLVGVTLSDSVEQVGAGAFMSSSIFYVDFGDGVAQVGDRAFVLCDNLTSVVFPEGMTALGYNAFSACHDLKSVVIPKSMVDLDAPFSQCEALTDIYYEGSEEEWNEKIGSRTDSAVTYHDNYGAEATKTLTKDMFSVDTGEETYTGSPITKTITGRDGEKTLVEGTDYAVSYTPNTAVGAVAITITGLGDYKGLVQYAFMIGLDPAVKDDFVVTADGTLIDYRGTQTDVEIPEGVTAIGDNAFSGDSELVSVTIPGTVTKIGAQGFANCSKLTKVILPVTLTGIGDDAFDGCGSLTDIYYAGSEAEWEAIEGRSKPAPGGGLTIHYNCGQFEDAGGRLQGESRSLAWSRTADGKVTVTGELAAGETVLLACYDGQGRLMSVKQIAEADRTAQLQSDCARAKLFWLGGAQQPMSPSALVWEAQ